MFFRLLPEHAWITDANEELINAYLCLRDRAQDVIDLLRVHAASHGKEYYYAIRALPKERSLSAAERAARLIYLNRTCYNGLYRVNSRGGFNVPFGRYKKPTICDEDLLRLVSAALRTARIETASFESILDRAQPGDFVYFDPPYHPLSVTSNFTSYYPKGFRAADQERLRDVYAELSRRGIQAMLSNSYCPFITDLYRDFRIEIVYAGRSINSAGDGRRKIAEALVLNF